MKQALTQSFLNSLKGKPLGEANAACEGYDVVGVPVGMPMAAIATPNTIILEHKDGLVVYAGAGDPCEINVP